MKEIPKEENTWYPGKKPPLPVVGSAGLRPAAAPSRRCARTAGAFGATTRNNNNNTQNSHRTRKRTRKAIEG